MADNSADLNLPLVTDQAASGRAAELFEASRHETGMVNNMYRIMANSPALLDAYRQAQALYREGSGLSRAEQEVILLTASRYDGCGYCMAAHSVIADVNHVPTTVTDAIRAGQPIPDPRLRALADFVVELLTTRAHPRPAAITAFLAAGYSAEQALGVVLGIAVITMSNFTNDLFHTPLDRVFQRRTWQADQ